MSGPAIAWYLMKTNATLLAQVPAARIFCGPIPLNTVRPAIGVTSVSGVDADNVAMSGNTLVTERVQVTIYAASYPSQKTLLGLVKAALPHTHGAVNGLACAAITPAGDGPDIYDDVTQLFEQSTDRMIKWHR
jgi:hypothetical protein